MRARVAVHLILVLAFIAGCSTVPLTGRKQVNFIPASEMLSMSYQQYGDFLKTNKLSTNQQQTLMVKNVGTKIQHAVEQFLTQKGLADRLQGYKWEFNLVESSEVNAWCMPGGKVVVYTGIMPIVQDDTGLAVVLGHEIAHAIAEHGGERMSQGLIAEAGGMALDAALQSKPEQTKALWMSVYGVGAQYGALLPYSRTHESEADHLGLIFMAMAGYDPHAAITFWGRMAQASAGKAPPEFLNTHPSDQTRIDDLKKELPEALTYYKK